MAAATPAGGSVWVLGDAATVMGFGLAGLRGRAVVSGPEAREALAALRAEGAALVLVTESICEALGGPEALVATAVLPVIAVIPSAVEPRTALPIGAQVLQTVHRALGIPGEDHG